MMLLMVFFLRSILDVHTLCPSSCNPLSGLRDSCRGEVTDLRRKAVDLASHTLMIRNTHVQVDATALEQMNAKNKASSALVELDALLAWRFCQDAECDEWGELWTDTGHVFTMDDGRPLQTTYVTRQFEKLRVEADLRKMTFHGSRREHASLLIASGADIALVSKRLRHSNIATTANTYTHLIASASRDAASRASSMVPRKPAPVHTLHTPDGIPDMKNALAGTSKGSDKGVCGSLLPDSNW
ncbi:tyrosine-type recombinase/integrase [Arthrobacter sp.]|uniref:tyrosine-type recombinase/integrase n=1 Tax=Arthrobacter sp. TaxID=1667 RepID=UPI003A92F717